MKYIEIKSEGYTYRYDFEPLQSNSETFNPNTIIPIENPSNASESLAIYLDLLTCVFGKEEVNKAIQSIDDRL